MAQPWCDIDWEAARPTRAEVESSRQRLNFEVVATALPAVATVMDELQKTHVNGGVIFKRFRVSVQDATLHWFASRNRFVEYDFFGAFLGSDGFRDALPELPCPDTSRDALGFRQSASGTLTLDGEIAAILVQGGPYERFGGTPTEAKRIGVAFSDALVGDRHNEFKVYTSANAWSPWFCDVAWDLTWLLIDMRHNEIAIGCITDSD